MCSMANYRKIQNLKRGLGKLDRQEKDYMENLANSLLKVQNAAIPQKSEGQESRGQKPKKQRKKPAENRQ